MSSTRLRRAFGAGALAVGLALAPQAARAADTVAFTIDDDRITESSGLATDARLQAYWTTNDSGDSGRVFAVDPTGKVLGTANYRADPVDVEALAMSGSRLYVGDIGDNDAQRKTITVYFFDDLTPGGGTATYRSYDFAYPDGAHDAEALLVNPDGRLFIVTKEATGGVYAAPTEPSRSVINSLQRVGDAPAYVTDGTFLPDGRIALRSYVSIEVLDPSSYQVIARAAAPSQPQGESITVDLAGTGLLLGSEGKKSQVWSAAIPTEVADAPTPASAPPTVTPSPSPSPTPTVASDGNAGISDALDRGTLVAVGGAALLAVIAGVVVGLARSRK